MVVGNARMLMVRVVFAEPVRTHQVA
jgi:hypothetical protein